ncbi:MAG: hypothetical protein R3F55_02825 [Alphaproteobacteria bacterium]
MQARTMLAAAAALTGGLAAPTAPAQACIVLLELRPAVALAAPVVVRGRIVAVEADAAGPARLTVAVDETLRGLAAAQWRVTWPANSVIGPPADPADAAARFGDTVIVGLNPDDPPLPQDRRSDGRPQVAAGTLAQEMCGAPFLGPATEMQAQLRAWGMAD